MVYKTIVINSYPRSASIFFLNIIYMIVGEKVHGASIHVPQLIGTKDVITCTIFRDPIDCITSRLFQSLGSKRIPNANIEEELIEIQSKEYMSYVEKIKASKAYYTLFDQVSSDPLTEAINFLKINNISVNQKSVENIQKSDMWTIMPHEKEGLYDGHYPRSAELNEGYIDIKKYVSKSPSVMEAKRAYLSIREGKKE